MISYHKVCQETLIPCQPLSPAVINGVEEKRKPETEVNKPKNIFPISNFTDPLLMCQPPSAAIL